MVGGGLLRRCSHSSDLHVKHRQKASDEFGRLGGQFDSVLSVDNDEDAMVTAGTSEARRKAAAIDAMVAICEVSVCWSGKEQNIPPLLDAYYEDVVNCLLEATAHLHEAVREKAVSARAECEG